MTEEIPKINLAAIRRLALKEFKFSRQQIQKNPGNELMPSLLVIVSDDLFDDTKWQYHKLVFPDFNENRYRMLAMVANEYAQRDEYLVAAILTTEAWVSLIEVKALKAHPENRIEPRLDPDRTEILMVAGMTLDQQGLFIKAGFKRDKEGKPVFEEMKTSWFGDDKYENHILQHFLAHYAKAVYERKKGQDNASSI